MKLKLLFGFPGWGWKMYGLASLSSGRMWFIGFSKQLPFFQPQELKYPDVAATAATMRDMAAQLDTTPNAKLTGAEPALSAERPR